MKLFLFLTIPSLSFAMGKAAPISMGPEWPVSSNLTTLNVSVDSAAQNQSILQIGYSMACAPEPAGQMEQFRGVTGQIDFGSRIARINLFEGENLVEVNLTDLASSVLTITLDPNPICTLSNLTAQIVTSDFSNSADIIARVALENSPYWGIRPDQYTNRYTDLPMMMSYRVYPDPSDPTDTDIDYIIYFSDEDSGKKAPSKSGDIGDYGRSSDIEWVYRVQFDQSWNALKRTIQTSFHIGSINLGFGHGQETFKGDFVGSHPIIYDATLNNVGADHSHEKSLVVYQLVPRFRMGLTDDVDEALLMAPWTYEVTSDEQTAENKAPAPVADHLFVMVEGELNGVGPFGWATGKFAAVASSTIGGETTDYRSETQGVSRAAIMGDSWLRDSIVTGVLIPENEVQNIESGLASGTVSFEKESFVRPDLNVKAIRFFRVLTDDSGELETRELTSLFTCDYQGIHSNCTYGLKPRTI